jgi:S-adenosylmethionine:diacylglycerol 3-amino-3-carboxypropyl transferase
MLDLMAAAIVTKSNELTSRMVHRAHDALFRRVHSSNLIYNTCWEDPRLDRQMLGLRSDSRVVMITSAGCNTLDYLLDDPAEIHAVDMNPRQNALLQLKIAMIEHGDGTELRQVFGEGMHPGFRDLLRQLSPWLTPYARSFWEEKHKYFEPTRSFYYRGAAGQVAWLVLQSVVKSNQRARRKSGESRPVTSVDRQLIHLLLFDLTADGDVNLVQLNHGFVERGFLLSNSEAQIDIERSRLPDDLADLLHLVSGKPSLRKSDGVNARREVSELITAL